MIETERQWSPKEVRALMRLGGFRPLTLAKELGVTKQAVNNWLAGRRVPRPKMKERMTLLEGRLWVG